MGDFLWRQDAVELLLGNYPQRKEITIDLRDYENDPAALADALWENNNITRIGFNLAGTAATANFDLLLQEVAQREILELGYLVDRQSGDERQPSIRWRPFLQAFRQNARIHNVSLKGTLLSGNDVATLVDNSPSISFFEMTECEAELQEDNTAIAAALGRSTTITFLSLGWLPAALVVAILEGLLQNRSVKKFHCNRRQSTNNQESLALGELLTSTTTIEELKIGGNFNVAQFQPICQGLVQSHSVTALRLSRCDLRGQEFNPLYRALF